MINHYSFRKTLDRIGVATSTLCAIHCLFIPLALALLPVAGIKLLADERIEWVFLCASILIGALSLIPSCITQHKKTIPIKVFSIGISLILVVRLIFEEDSAFGKTLLIFGAFIVAGSHIWNRRLCRACSVCEAKLPDQM